MTILKSLFGQPPEPNLRYAALGYLQVAVARRYSPHLDLNRLEKGFALQLLDQGCSKVQALSARWGGAYAIVDDLCDFDDAVTAYKETAAEAGFKGHRTREQADHMFNTAALLVISTAYVADRKEYGRFLSFIGA